MLKYFRQVQLASSCVAMILLLFSISSVAGNPDLNSKLQDIITQVQTQSDQRAALDELLNLMMGIDSNSLDAKTIDCLVALLSSPHYDVRKVATISLGQIDRKAKNPDKELNEKLEKIIEKTRKGKSASDRIAAAECLSQSTVGIDPMYVSDETIEDMISLLDDPNDGVIAYVSAALGVFGPRAKAAVSKLLAILPSIDCIKADVSPSGFIRVSLKRMGVDPPPFDPKKCK